MDEQAQPPPLPEPPAAELLDFEDFSRRAIQLGFTVHLTHYRFHPVHTADAPVCQSGVKLCIIPILNEAKVRFGGPDGGFRDVYGETIAAVLPRGHLLLDRYESGENLWTNTRSRKRHNLSDEERDRRRQRMRDYWAKKRNEPAETTAAGD